MNITIADLSASDLQELLKFHLMEAANQKCSTAFAIDRLAAPDIHFFEARHENGDLMGCAGLKILSTNHGEIKSVRTHPDYLRKGVSVALMDQITKTAITEGLTKLSLETHPTPAYAAARALYERLGYTYCGPFGEYSCSEQSVFMEKNICLLPS